MNHKQIMTVSMVLVFIGLAIAVHAGLNEVEDIRPCSYGGKEVVGSLCKGKYVPEYYGYGMVLVFSGILGGIIAISIKDGIFG